MPSDGKIWHGGNLDEARRQFPDAPEPWIDLSTGINPVAFPLPVIPPDVFRRLPASSELAKLERIAAEAYGARPDEIVAAPGTQALIETLPRLRPASRVAVVGPTYAEHAQSWRKAGHAVCEVSSPEEGTAHGTWTRGAASPRRREEGSASLGAQMRFRRDVGEGADVVVIVNPNNPDGRSWRRADLAQAAARLTARDGWLVVDEAFVDIEDIESLAGERPDGVVVLRSFGKTYGLAGIRLGFLIAAPDLVARVRASLGPWAVSGPALAIGQAALADFRWREQATRDRLRDAERLDALVRPAIDRVVGGTRLFRCYETAHAPALFNRLGRHGIWVRRFQDAPERLRLGLPGSEAEWARLAASLA
jgi:cobalamin biosynthetic protein CobC